MQLQFTLGSYKSEVENYRYFLGFQRMNSDFKLMISQFNPTLGDLEKNYQRILDAHSRAIEKGVDLVALPEMSLTGYQVQDLILKPAFLTEVHLKIAKLASVLAEGIPLLIGAPSCEKGHIYNAYYLIKSGSPTIISRKHHLPNTNVFDEQRIFSSAPISNSFEINGIKIGSPICEDLWFEDVVAAMAKNGAQILISPNGSPYARSKINIRHEVVSKRSTEIKAPIVYINMTGGQDDLVFDGASFVMNPGGKLAVQTSQFEETDELIQFFRTGDGWAAKPGISCIYGSEIAQDYRAMVESVKEYTKKTGFKKVLVGLSGGIDSALVAVIAADAIGAPNVLCVRLPSKFSSKGSLDDAAALINNLGCLEETISIDQANDTVNASLAAVFKGYKEDLTEENIQSRIRGLILMALSNKFNMMLLTTGNKSEVAVGYSTIYGDMAGGYNPIKDLYKTRVFQTSLWRNKHYESWMNGPQGEIIPRAIIEKPPSAELRFEQRDDQSLPPYDELDSILAGLIDDDLSVKELVDRGFEKRIVQEIENLVYLSEYKRFQAAPGPNLTDRAFWLGRRYPLVQRWRDKS